MPTYEYECSHCGHKFEKFQSITAAPVKKCPVCGKKVKRLIGTGAGLIFKGSGFYITDYRSDNYKEGAKSESGAPDAKPSESTPSDNGAAKETKPTTPKAQTTPPSKSEPKPAAKSEPKAPKTKS